MTRLTPCPVSGLVVAVRRGNSTKAAS
jgi:hypothetical protein